MHVDANDRLETENVQATFNILSDVDYGSSPISSPTTATLAISRVAFGNPLDNESYPHTTFQVFLAQYRADSDGQCNTGSVVSYYSDDTVDIGTDSVDTYTTPLLIRRLPSEQPYCLGITMNSADDTAPSTYYSPSVQITGYVANGSYSGPGTLARPLRANPTRLVHAR